MGIAAEMLEIAGGDPEFEHPGPPYSLDNPVIVNNLAIHDSMPRAWRELVYEYGLKPTNGLYVTGESVESARELLHQMQMARQVEWNRLRCRVKFVTKSSFFKGVGGFKSETDRGSALNKTKFSI